MSSGCHPEAQGGLASPDDGDVRRIAAHCLRLWDGPQSAGHTHAQSRRFLDPAWAGLPEGSSGKPDPPLRELVVALAEGDKTMVDFISGGTEQEQSLVEWVAAFRLATPLVILGLPFLSFKNANGQWTRKSNFEKIVVLCSCSR